MSYKVAGIDVHKKMLAVVISNVIDTHRKSSARALRVVRSGRKAALASRPPG
jgi:hypothetical protein